MSFVRFKGRRRAAPAGLGRRAQRLTAAVEALEARTLLSGATLHVDGRATGAGTGETWADAFPNLQLALAQAAADDTIRVAGGTYKPTDTTNRTVSFALKSGVGIYGGFAGLGAADPDRRDVRQFTTVLSGDIGTIGKPTDNSHHVVTANGVTAATVLDGLTIADGYAGGPGALIPPPAPEIAGGGLYLVNSSPTLVGCTITRNTTSTLSTVGGGGIYASASSPTLIGCVLSSNSALGGGSGLNRGGAMYNTQGSRPTLINCVVAANATRVSAPPDVSLGGGIYNTGSSFSTLINCTLAGNVSSRGAAIASAASSGATLINSIVWGNAAESGTQIEDLGQRTTVTFSAVQGGYVGAGNVDADPRFVRSPWAGPDGQFETADDDAGDLRLRTGTPLVDAGSTPDVPAGTVADLAGNARVQGDAVDIGAYEGTAAAPAARVLYVNADAAGAGTGDSWADAYPTFGAALAAAADGDAIRIAAGTYRPTAAANRSAAFALRSGVSVHGGYAGPLAGVAADTRDVRQYRTILSGDIGASGDSTDNSYRVVTGHGLARSTVLDGVTLTGGYGAPAERAGGLYLIGGAPTLSNCVFAGNTASYGGGIGVAGSSPTLINCVVTNNSAAYGGGMYADAASRPTVVNCTFASNTASTSGGGIHSEAPTLSVSNSIVWGNAAPAAPQIYRTNVAGVQFSTVQGGYPGPGNTSANPMFVRTPWAGPDGAFGTADDDAGDVRLRPGSPAIDAGSDAAVPPGTATDADGGDRIQGARVDVGAFEGAVASPPPRVLYVDAAAPGAAGTGGSWADAFAGLQPALAAARDGDTIRVADGVYKPTGGTARGVSFGLRSGVAIVGGYAGLGAADPDARDVARFPTVLSGDIGAAGVKTDNSYRVTTGIALSDSALLDGVTIERGNANDNSTLQGGGLYLLGGSPRFTDCTFRDNYGGHGGGAHFRASAPTLTRCTFVGNTAQTGGAIGNNGASPVFNQCAFTLNTAWGGGGGAITNGQSSSTRLTDCTFDRNENGVDGSGGIENDRSSLVLTRCRFTDNDGEDGGALGCGDGSTLTITDCTFEDNSSGIRGGGLFLASSNEFLPSTATLTGCTFLRNWAPEGGGGIMTYGASLVLVNCTFGGNGAEQGGGAIFNNGGSTATLTNCVFSLNYANRSATIYSVGAFFNAGTATLVNCTFSGNRGVSTPFTLYNSAGAKLTVKNSVLWAQTSANFFRAEASATTTITYSDVPIDLPGVGNVHVEPTFVRKTGGAGSTDYGDLRLQPSSPLIDAGTNASIPAGVTTDRDGLPRIAGGRVDIGAYEFRILDGDANRDRAVDVHDLLALGQNYNVTDGQRTWAQGDFNADGNVDVTDLLILGQQYGTSLDGPAAPVTSAPAEVVSPAFASPANPPPPVPAKSPAAGSPVPAKRPATSPVTPSARRPVPASAARAKYKPAEYKPAPIPARPTVAPARIAAQQGVTPVSKPAASRPPTFGSSRICVRRDLLGVLA